MKIINYFFRKPQFKQYLIIGISAFVIEYSIFYLFSFLGMMLIVSQSVSFMCGLTISFIGNKTLTFQTKESEYVLNGASQLWRYCLLASTNLLLSNLTIHGLVDYLGVEPLVAKVLVMVAVVGWNYILFNKIIFRTK